MALIKKAALCMKRLYLDVMWYNVYICCHGLNGEIVSSLCPLVRKGGDSV